MQMDLKWSNERLEMRFQKAARNARLNAVKFLMQMGDGMAGRTVHELWLVHSVIGARLIHRHSGILQLLESRYPSVAAIVLLTQFELRLDILYIGTDTSRATEWVEHTNQKTQPWPVKTKIKNIFPVQSDVDLYLTLYRWLSGIKHGNPAWSNSAFSVRAAGDSRRIATDEFDDDQSKAMACLLYAFSSWQVLDALATAGPVYLHFNGFGEKSLEQIRKDRSEAAAHLADADTIATRSGIFDSAQFSLVASVAAFPESK